MASTSSSHQQDAFSGIESPNKRRKIEESSRVYDVFINHRGPDVKETLATQLYNSLKALGISAFLDYEEKERGVSFISTIETAIRSASVHIAIFSQKYAESDWCLRELVLMLQSNAKIIPVFYQVKPWELRYIEKGVYGEAFLKYEEKGRYLDKLEEWKKALQKVSFTAGDVFENSGSDVCKDIVSAVEKEVQRTRCLHVAKHPVGLDKLVKVFERRCLDKLVQDFESQCGMTKANVVGIFGMGGVGKTTLSKQLFNQKRSNYIRASFLSDVREAYGRGTLPLLQRKLLEDIFCDNTSNKEGTSYLRHCFERSPTLSFLIVLDDIDHVEQLDTLLPMDILNKHGNGNHLVIVTTRDVGVLVSAEIDIAYHLRGLDREDGRELFCWHAFKQSLPLGGYEDLVEAFVNVCGGLPLSLIVLGRHVSRRPQWYWQDELEKVKETLPVDIKERLKISINRLDDVEKQIFMDIACFFIGKSITKAMLIWKGSGWRARRALETLKERCLVEEVKEEHLNRLEYKWESCAFGLALRMHDHLRDLGREMADELSYPHRVWRPQDLKSLESDGFQNILTQTKSRIFHSIVDKSIGCGITYFLGKPKDGSDASLLWLQIEYLSWPQVDLRSQINSSIPWWIPLQNLQCLRISNGHFQKLWQSDVQAPLHLEELQIRDTFLEQFPDLLGKLNNIRKLVLHAKDIQTDIWSLLKSLRMNLHSLKMVGSALAGDLAFNDSAEGPAFQSLVIYDFQLHWEGDLALNNKGWCETVLREVEYLEINGYGLVTRILSNGNCCQSLKSLKICELQNLIEVDLARIKTLNCLEITECEKFKKLSPTSDPCKLVNLKISECLELEEISLAHLSCLQKITIENCNHLKSVSGISNLAKLVELEISGCKMLEFECLCLKRTKYLERLAVDRYVKIKYFQMDGCENLKTVMFDYRNIEKLSIRYCAELEKLPDLIGPSCLKRIIIDGCGNLKYLRLHGLENLESLSGNLELRQVDIIKCPVLRQVDIIKCPVVEELPSLDKVGCLEQIKIHSCEKLHNITLPTTLIKLDLQSCKDLQRVTVVGDLTKLKHLIIRNCPALEELPSLDKVGCLEQIKIHSCKKLHNITLPTTLIKLDLQSCEDLQSVTVVGDFTKLEQLFIRDCPALGELPSFARVSCLEGIQIFSCEKLQNITLPTTLNKLAVQFCRDLQSVTVVGDFTKLEQLILRDCPALGELPSFARVSCLEGIQIFSCEKLQNITLPTTLNKLDVQFCRDLQSVTVVGDFTKLEQLILRDCPALGELPSFARVSCLEGIQIFSCEKLQNITLPTTLNKLAVQFCRDLQSVTVVGDFTKLEQLILRDCPALGELPSFARVSCLEGIQIFFCEKLQNITLPTTLNKLDVQFCRDLQSVTVVGDFTKLEQLILRDCPALGELPSFARVSCLEGIQIFSCEKLQNITLPTTLNKLDVQFCRDLQSVTVVGDFTKLEQLILRDCPALGELPSFASVSCLEEIQMRFCENLQNITLPSTLKKLNVQCCRDLETVAVAGDLTKIEQLILTYCPALEELPSFHRVSCLEGIQILSCKKLKNIMLPTTLIKLDLQGCKDLQRVTVVGDLTRLKQLIIRDCPALGELPSFASVSCLKEIQMRSCENLQKITLPSTLNKLDIECCRDLEIVAVAGDLTKLKQLLITDCPALKELPSFHKLNCMWEIQMGSCEKVQNIMVPTTVIKLDVQNCRDLRRVAVAGDLTNLKKLIIRDCPAFEELPSPDTLNCLEEIQIDSCEKLQNITLPTTLICLSVKGCWILQRIAGITDFTKLEELRIDECPELELPCLSRLIRLRKIFIDSCENLQNVSAIEELHVSQYMGLTYCSYAVTRYLIDKLKSVPEQTCVIGKAVDGAESYMEEDLFSDTNNGVDGVIEINIDEANPEMSEVGAAMLCLMVVIDSSSLAEATTSEFAEFGYDCKIRRGESMITVVEDTEFYGDFISLFLDQLCSHGVVKKGFWVDLTKVEKWKWLELLRTIVDRLYDHE